MLRERFAAQLLCTFDEARSALVTLLRRDRLRLLNARRTELLGLVSIFEQKSESEAFIDEIKGRLTEIDQHIADVECYRA